MRCCLFIVILTTCVATGAAQAGPWLREKGSGFAAMSFSGTYFLDTVQTTYLEYGLLDDLTLGADVALNTDHFGYPTGAATLFLRRPLGDPDGKHRFAYELGLGASWDPYVILPHLKTTLSWGRGLSLRGKNGWANVDASLTFDLYQITRSVKLDSTFGLAFNDRFIGMMQLYLSQQSSRTHAKLAPALVISLGKGKSRLQIGAEIPLYDSRNAALKVALWRDF